jgi:hypothetical protein
VVHAVAVTAGIAEMHVVCFIKKKCDWGITPRGAAWFAAGVLVNAVAATAGWWRNGLLVLFKKKSARTSRPSWKHASLQKPSIKIVLP